MEPDLLRHEKFIGIEVISCLSGVSCLVVVMGKPCSLNVDEA